MNHHLHRLHHQHPTLPWTALQTLASETRDDPNGSNAPAYFRSALRQFKGPGAIDAATTAQRAAH